MTDLSKVDIVVTCRLGFDKIVATYIKELDESVQVVSSPYGLTGMVLIIGARDKYELARKIKESVPEVEKVFVVEGYAKARIDDIIEVIKNLVKDRIGSNETFAVRTVRRGRHDFTSLDVNAAVGAVVKQITGATVDLENPDKVVMIQIVHDHAYISIVPGAEFYKKMKPYKYPMYKLFRRFVVAHEPYLGPIDAAYTMGTRIGREVQTFEIGELVVAPIGRVDAFSLYHFLRGLFEGIESRYEIQRKSYGREVHKVKVTIQDMYQFVRDRMNETIIVFEPEGEPISKVANEVRNLVLNTIKKGRKVYLMVGAREGVPTGVFRFASMVLDVAPGIVISTDYALSSALIAIATILHEALVEEREEIDKVL